MAACGGFLYISGGWSRMYSVVDDLKTLVDGKARFRG